MAQFDANIKVLLDAQAAYRQIAKLESRLEKLQDPRSKIKVRDVIRKDREAVKASEKGLRNEISLSAAVQRRVTVEKALNRAGIENNKEAAQRVRNLQKAGDAGKGILSIQNAVNAGLEKELQIRRELNRTAIGRERGLRQRSAFNERINRLSASNVTDSALAPVRKLRDKFGAAVEKGELDEAKRLNAQLQQKIKLLERVNKIQRPGTLSGGARSPVRGSKSTPNSPKYLEAQADALDKVAKAEERRTKAEQRRNQAAGGARSPVSGSKNTVGSPKYLEAKAAALDKVAKAEQRRNQAAGGARSPIRGSKNTVGSPKYLEAQARAIKNLAKAGGPSSRLPQRSVLGSDESLRKKAEYYERINKAIKPISSPLRPQSVLGSDESLRRKAEYYERINKAVRGPSSSLKDAPARTLLDSNSALRQKAKYYEQIQRASKATKNNTAATAKNVDRTAKSAKALTKGSGKKGQGILGFGQTATNLSAGAGFPLLFGGGPGSVLGGVGGALAGGFGGSIIGGAIGTQIDKLGASALRTADALAKPTTNLEALIDVLGIAGSKLKSDLEVLQELGLGSVASAAATNEFEALYGSEAAQKFKQLKGDFDKFTNGVQQLGVAISKLLAGPFGRLLSGLGSFASQAATASTVGDLEKSLSGEELKRFRKRKAELQKAIPGAFGSTTLQPLTATDEETLFKEFGKQTTEKKGLLDLDAQITAEMNRQLLLAEKTTAVEAGRLTNRRDVQAAISSEVQVQAALNNLVKINLNLENEKEKTKRRLLELDQKLAQEQLEQSQLAKQNAIRQAQLQIYKDEQKARISAFKVAGEIYQAELKTVSLSQTAYDQAQNNLTAAREAASTQEQILRAQFALRKLDIKELEVKIEEAILLETKVDKLKAELALKEKQINQAEVLRQLGFDQYNQQQKINTLLAEQNALQSQQANDPARDIGFGVQGFGFFGDSFKLEADLFQKYNNDLAVFNLKIEDAKANLAKLTTAEIRDGRADPFLKQLDTLEVLKSDYERLQPAIIAAALEQQRFNDALTAVSPGVNALVGGLRSVVAGTKSVEEAFADFLNTIADQLAQTAAQMIAQYIALGIARAFATGTNPTSFLGSSGGGLGQLFGNYNGLSGIPYAGEFANGGRIPSGQFGLVGENGPEFINGPARITPMGEGGSTVVNITVNSDGGGTSSASGNNAQDAARLGRLIERSTLAIINREKRAGGTLSR